MEVSRYHKFLRTSLIVTAFVLVFDAGLLTPVSKQFSDATISYLASVGSGMYASVPPNELNTLSAQLREQQDLLNAREAALQEREIATRDFGGEASRDYSTFILSIILFILTALIVLNYAMDFNRLRSLRYEGATR